MSTPEQPARSSVPVASPTTASGPWPFVPPVIAWRCGTGSAQAQRKSAIQAGERDPTNSRWYHDVAW
jgi:hypothetical protein